MIEQAIIIAAGGGVRLGPLTKDRPRAMLPVLGKPIVVRIMDRMREAGIQKFIVVVGEHEGAVAAYLNSSWVPDAKIQIVLQPFPRGTANALSCAAGYITGPFLLATADNLVPAAHIAGLIKRFNEQNADLILSTVSASSGDVADLPSVTADGTKITAISPTPAHSRRGLATFTLHASGKRILNHLDEGSSKTQANFELCSAIQGLIGSGGKVGHLTADWHMHLAKELDLLTINKRLLREGRDTHILSEIPSSVQITPPVRIDPQVSVSPGAKLGPNVYLETGASVGQDAVIWDSMVLSNAAIPPKEILHGQLVSRRERISELPPEPEPTEPE
jgi:UDP-N-acetylglucosamine diphosphorylase / glucose-1-phosphate thymidylyltransferase / UDP-N-acetylgalactosamine diphosphorylase / glucosamine-1-phosphate N-acetyltransferase / galactosamine-1-phosphate N-acetyltransferase